MAERRMFAKTIIDSDAFLEMPASTQNLYFHFGMRADDDGFLNNPKRIMRTMGASEDDLKLLIAKRFVIPFESGICVIKHWRIHNLIRNDRYKPTVYKDEMARLELKENSSYTLKNQEELLGIPNGNQMEPQVRLGKVRLGKVRLGNICEINPTDKPKTIDSTPEMKLEKAEKSLEKEKRKQFIPPTVGEILDYCRERNNKVEPERFIDFYEAKGWMIGKNKMKNWKAAVRTWERNDKTIPDKQKKNKYEDIYL